MKSSFSDSEEKIKKATEVLWKFFWFCFYLIIMPFLISLISFYIFQLFTREIYVVLGFTVIIFMFSLLFFYKLFDKYRKKPFFKKIENNLTARINILFLITIVSLIITPIFVFISPDEYSFDLLPVISFILLYNIVWFYYYYQPIATFSPREGKFKYQLKFSASIKQWHNLIIIANYFIHLLFLFVLFYTGISWLFLLITNIIFYVIAILFTKKKRSQIKKAIKEKRNFLIDLINFQKKFVLIVDSIIFSILIQIAIIPILIPHPGIQYTNILWYIYGILIIIFIVFYFKSIFYIFFHYESRINHILIIRKQRQSPEYLSKKANLYQKFSSIFSGILIFIIILFSFLINNLFILLIILPFIYIISYYERRAEYNFEKYNNWIYLINTIAILATISFGILPSVSDFFIINIQLIIFCLLLYFLLEIFVKFKVFSKGYIRLAQNFLIVTGYFSLVYLFYPLIFTEYITFTINTTLILISAILINLIIFLTVLLISFYRYYPRFRKKESLKSFKVCIFLNFFLIELFLFILINIRFFFILDFSIFINILFLSMILIPAILLLFLFINYLIKVFSTRSFLIYCYCTFWILIITIFLSLLIIFYAYFIVILLDLLLLSILIHYQLKLGFKLDRIAEKTFNNLIRTNIYFLICIIFSISFSTLFLLILFDFVVIWTNLLYSAFISLVLTCILINIYADREKYFSKAFNFRINIITMLYFIFLTFYFFLLLTEGTFYIIITPIMVSSIIFYVPIIYLFKKKKSKKLIEKLLFINSLILSSTLLLIPTIIYLELYRTEFFTGLHYFVLIFFIITLINATFSILSLILLFGYGISRIFKGKKGFQILILKFLVILTIILIFTVVFYYPFYFFYGTYYCLLLPIIFTSCALYFPLYFSYKKEFFNTNLIKRLIIYDSLVLTCSILIIPTIIGLELTRLGFSVDIILIILFTIVLLFGFLKFLDFNTKRFQFKLKYQIRLKFFQLYSWLSITILIFIEFAVYLFILPFSLLSIFIIGISSFIFFTLNLFSLKQINDLKDKILEDKYLMLSYLKLFTFFEYFRNFIFFGLIFSISLLFMTLFQIHYIFMLLPPELFLLGLFWYLGFYFSFILSFLIISEFLIKLKFSKYTPYLELVSWIYIKICISITLAIFIFQFSIINKICLGFLVFSLLTPISYYFFKKTKLNISKYEFFIKRLITYIFLATLIIFYIEIFVFFTFNKSIPFFYNNPVILISLIIGNLYLLSNFSLLMAKHSFEKKNVYHIYYFYGLVGIPFFSLLYFTPIISLFLLILSYLILLYYRNYNLVFRFILYIILSYVTLIEFLAFFDTYRILSAFKEIPIGFYILIFLTSIISVLFTSIILNFSKNNLYENFSLYSLISVLSFVFFFTYTNILIIYNITISLFIFCLFTGIRLYYVEDKRYKWFIKPCILLFIFDFISWISYSFLFINLKHISFNPILTFTLTITATGLGFILLYNKSPEGFRNKSFSVVLPSIIVFFPIFIYSILITYFPISIAPIIAIIIALNFGIFLFYFSIGIYQWKLSWSIWKSGWWMWNLLPIVNFIIIYNTVSGINVLTNAINILGDIDILFITIILCILLWLPALYELVKDHFLQVLFFIWGCSLFLVYYVSLNIFIGDIPLTNSFFIIFSTISIIPLIYKLKYWKILSLMWLFLGVINILFFWFFLNSIGISNTSIIIAVLILIFGLFFHIYSFFPNIRSHRFLILMSSYLMVLLGIFLTIYTIIFSIVLNIFISINITFIIIASTLFSSKYIKVNKKLINYIASWIFIINISLLTFNTISLIPGLELFAFFLSITVFGGSFYVFNLYKIIGPINKGIPWMVMGFGLASSISSFFLIFLDLSILLICAIYSSILFTFLYFSLEDYKFIMFYLIPIPIAFLFLTFLGISVLDIIILVWLIVYIVSFQLLINCVYEFLEDSTIEEKKYLLKFYKEENHLKLINFLCFFIIFTLLSIIISILLPLSLYYQVLSFLLIWPILMLLCFWHFKHSKLSLKFPKLARFLNVMSLIMYFFIPASITFIFSINLIDLKINIIYLIFLSVMFFSGILFLEICFIDKIILKLLTKNLNKWLTLLSWGFACNFSCYFFFLFHYNPYLLILTLVLTNIVTNYFLKQIDINRMERYSKARIFLIYIALTTFALYLASAISDTVVFYYKELIGTPYTLLFLLISFSFLFIFSYFFNKNIKEQFKNWIEFILFLSIQILFGAFYCIFVFLLIKIMNLFTVFLIILIETFLSYGSVNYFNQIIIKDKVSGFLANAYSFITLIIYLEISFLFLGFFIDFLGFYGSFLISQIILFLFIISDIHVIKKLNKSLAYFIQTVSYILISAFIFVILLQLLNFKYIAFCLFLLITMQFYTNYSFFMFLTKLKPLSIESFKNVENKLKSIIGIAFYTFLIFFIQNTIILMPWEFQFLILSALVHVLMILDKLYFKFLGKLSNIVKFLSWVLIMVFSSIYLYWIFNFYFYDVLITVIPLIIVILVAEFAYFMKLLEFIQKITNNKEKIKKVLIFILYINFITWPLYFVSFDFLVIINLFLISTIIFWILTLIDGSLKIIKKKLRIFLRKVSFLLIGLLFSADLFILLTPYMVFLFNFSIACLIFLIFAAYVIKPYKKKSFLTCAYWDLCFLFISIIFYYIFLSLEISLFFFLITFGLPWFIFFIERLREIFIKIFNAIVIVLKKIKQAIKSALKRMFAFIKKYFKYIWIFISLSLALIFAFLVSPFLNIIHLIFSTLAVFGLLYSVLPSKKIDDPDKMFSRKMKKLIIIWGSVIGIIFLFIPLLYLMLMIFIAILILGAIILPYISHKEKKENISIKWKFYTTIFFIIILIITGILVFLQFVWILIIG